MKTPCNRFPSLRDAINVGGTPPGYLIGAEHRTALTTPSLHAALLWNGFAKSGKKTCTFATNNNRCPETFLSDSRCLMPILPFLCKWEYVRGPQRFGIQRSRDKRECTHRVLRTEGWKHGRPTRTNTARCPGRVSDH